VAEAPPGADRRRERLIELFHAGLARVEGRRCVREALQGGAPTRVWAAAIGKAAASMALGAREALGPALEQLLVIAPVGHGAEALAAAPGTEVLFGAHPIPDERSLHAGARLLGWLRQLPAQAEALFLISGGASALVEVPAPGVTLEQIARVARHGMAAGLDISALNAERTRCSQIKGGRLAERLGGHCGRVLFMSDVPGDDPALIGSGLLGPAPGGDALRREVIASIDAAMDGVAEAARVRGLTVQRARMRFGGEVQRLATQFTHELALGSAQVYLWGGESTVRLPAAPGRGGRNQHLALAAARLIAGYGDLALLAAGTDGIDGPTEDAGAVIDGETCGRIAVLGFDADDSLRRADSGCALAAAGALLRTGPTGTNVADLVIGLKDAPQRAVL
jgi:hydroxypyruvate reductase